MHLVKVAFTLALLVRKYTKWRRKDPVDVADPVTKLIETVENKVNVGVKPGSTCRRPSFVPHTDALSSNFSAGVRKNVLKKCDVVSLSFIVDDVKCSRVAGEFFRPFSGTRRLRRSRRPLGPHHVSQGAVGRLSAR